MKFVIVSNRQWCGGAIVLHTLCKYLQDMGFEASVYYIGEYKYKKGNKVRFWIGQVFFSIKDFVKKICARLLKKLNYFNKVNLSGYINCSIDGCKQKFLPIVDHKTIVVYPEIVYGNFFHARKVVRWFLSYNRYDQNAYGENDLFFTYRDVFNDSKFNPENRRLCTPYFNLELYKKTNYGNRSGKCFVIRKGKNRPDLPKDFDGIIIDEMLEEEKVAVFNECEYCISYDTQTAYTTIAAICGCTSIVVPEPGKSWMDYCDSIEEKYGVAYSFDAEEIEWARQTVEKARERCNKINQDGRKSVEEFVKQCKEYFGEKDNF